ncbi:hypothetical protein AB0N77_09800 [Streptomyces misionensis]|uniref:hypothetical protein n=1 Tax=Streptomyces misionensis TaxID=67331 RepID=UPI00343CFA35
MSKHGVRPGKLRISGAGGPGAQVELDGQNIAGSLTGLTLRLGVDEMPTATLDLLIHDFGAETEARFVLPDECRDLLVRLGWTPPAEEAQS